jgi:hypothetical protein
MSNNLNNIVQTDREENNKMFLLQRRLLSSIRPVSVRSAINNNFNSTTRKSNLVKRPK